MLFKLSICSIILLLVVPGGWCEIGRAPNCAQYKDNLDAVLQEIPQIAEFAYQRTVAATTSGGLNRNDLRVVEWTFFTYFGQGSLDGVPQTLQTITRKSLLKELLRD